MIRLAALSALRPDRALYVVHERHRLALFLIDGVVQAIDDGCPHRGASLSNGVLLGRMIECPLHGWTFDVTTGCMRGAPAIRVRRYEVEVRGDDVFVGL